MPAARDDYLLRLITQAAAALRRLRGKLAGGGATEEIVRDAGAAIGELLGPQRSVLDRLDAASAAQIVGNDDTIRAWSELLILQADAEAARGNSAVEQRLRQRAHSLAAHLKETP